MIEVTDVALRQAAGEGMDAFIPSPVLIRKK